MRNKFKNKKIQKEITFYGSQFNELFSNIVGRDKKDIWVKGAKKYLELLKRIEKLSKQGKINRLQKSRMTKALDLIYDIHYWKNNPNLSISVLKNAGDYFMDESLISTFEGAFKK